MSQRQALEQSYLLFIEFLMQSKHRVFKVANGYGLTGMQAMTLFLLDCPRPMNSFGKVFNCDPSNVTGIVDGLEEKGLVKRFENPQDRRVKMVEACDQGVMIRAAMLAELTGPDSYIVQRLTAAEIDQFTSLVGKITGRELAAGPDR